MVALRAGVDLRDQPGAQAHARAFGQHRAAKGLAFGGVGLAREHLVIQRPGPGGGLTIGARATVSCSARTPLSAGKSRLSPSSGMAFFASLW